MMFRKQLPWGAAEARHGEDRFRLLVEGATEYAMFLVSPDGRIASWNEGRDAS
jgi:hypothetical protein